MAAASEIDQTREKQVSTTNSRDQDFVPAKPGTRRIVPERAGSAG